MATNKKPAEAGFLLSTEKNIGVPIDSAFGIPILSLHRITNHQAATNDGGAYGYASYRNGFLSASRVPHVVDVGDQKAWLSKVRAALLQVAEHFKA